MKDFWRRVWGDLRWRAALCLAVVTGFRLWFCTYHELVPDEAYYWLWSKHLDMGYYSKGPAVAWTIAAGTGLWGDTVFGIRFFSVLLSAGTGWLVFDLARRLFDGRVGWWVLVGVGTLPIFAVGSVLMTIDPLSVFFWVCAAHGLWRGVAGEGLRHWVWAGFAVGCGFLAKQINALQLVCGVGWLLADRERRRWFMRPHFWAMVGVAGVCMLPVFVWNAQHGWITAQHLHERAALTEGWKMRPGEFFQFLVQQALVISPGYFVLMLVAWGGWVWRWWVQRQSGGQAEPFCAWMAWPVFALYAGLAWNEAGEANWTVTMLPTGMLLAVVWWRERWGSRVARGWIYGAVGVAVVMTVMVHETAWLRLKPRLDPLVRARGWRSLVDQVDEVRRAYPQAILIGNKYQTVSILSFYLPDRPRVYQPKVGRVVNQLSLWGDYDETRVTEALFVTDALDGLPEPLQGQFREWREVARLRPAAPWEGLRVWRVIYMKR
ncbi:MAG: glycosyltransferase family 39 protein [Methylacidiphilales bacterium]|nr:glycosyltransferase family 39 protein [Candidatus Methylacidiphilales bacterium]MDW8350232.1 glycosyltransferase family 39 protein [Verrucomicrobiae bacterium]